MKDDLTISCYAIRRLNPFLGVLQMIEIDGGRASTTNGVVWHIELQTTKPTAWGSLSASEEQKSWFLFGLWSEKEGLVKAPTSSSRKDLTVAQLNKAILNHQHELPFALADHRELWLLDEKQQKPLALLMSMLPESTLHSQKPRYWKGCLQSAGVGTQHRFAEIDRLEMEVRKRAGFNPDCLWVTWDTDHNQGETIQGEHLSRDLFPAFGIAEDWADESNKSLVQSYIDWMAPALLTLPYLNKTERTRLESNLHKRACRIEYYWRLYPRILDKKKLVSARVQARMASEFSNDIVG
jgi:hypothetical protein